MAISVARSAARARLRLPRGTARLRLTALYGGLFLACGTVLLAVSYVLARAGHRPGRARSTKRPSLTSRFRPASSRSTGASKLSPLARFPC